MQQLARCPRGHEFVFTDDQVDDEDGTLDCPRCMAAFDPYAKPSPAAARSEESGQVSGGVAGLGLVNDGPDGKP